MIALTFVAIAIAGIVWLLRVAAQHDRDAAVGSWMREEP